MKTGRPRKWTNDAERKQAYRDRLKQEGKRASSGKSGKYKPTDPVFIACDGESVYNDDGDQVYCLFAASDGRRIGKPGVPIKTTEFLDFILATPRGQTLVAYGAGYDIECGLHDLTEKQWREIAETPYHPVKGVMVKIGGKRYEIAYLPNKKLTVSSGGRRATLYNVLPFFQVPFLDVITGAKRIATPTEEELALIEWGKEARKAFTTDQWERIVAYNDAECQLLVRVMDRLWEALKALGVRPASWHGPGAIAKALFRMHGMEKHLQKPPEAVWNACKIAYFGGRNQCFKIGVIPAVYNYDLGSAYPWGIVKLPSTVGVWQEFGAGEYFADTPWALYHVRWNVGQYPEGTPRVQKKSINPLHPLTPFPWRDKEGMINFPPRGEGWYWGPEVFQAVSLWGDRIEILGGYLFHPAERDVFSWLKPLSDARMEAKRLAQDADTQEKREFYYALERAGKLGPNSLYGQTAQTVGRAPFYHPLWAGLITSFTRGRMLEAMAQNPQSLVMCATDGLFTTERLTLEPRGKGLGEWDGDDETSPACEMHLYQTGVYTLIDPEGDGKNRTRGFDARSVTWADVASVWKEWGAYGSVEVSQSFLCGHRQALHENKPELQGKFVTRKRKLRLSPYVGLLRFVFETHKSYTFIPWETWEGGLERYKQMSAPFAKWTDLERDGALPYAEDALDGDEGFDVLT